MMEFLESVLGPDAEIVLHDVSDLSHSIVALVNGSLSNRSVGGPATDFALRILNDEKLRGRDFIGPYRSRASEGKLLRSSTCLIHDAAGDTVGMLCVNIDDSAVRDAIAVLNRLTHTQERGIAFDPVDVSTDALVVIGGCADGEEDAQEDDAGHVEVSEELSGSVSELTRSAMESIVRARGVSPERMTRGERLEVIQELDNAGIFLVKGAVAHIAAILRVSEPSMYRYLKQVRVAAV
jgi:predicted transcriptional regulator YheO